MSKKAEAVEPPTSALTAVRGLMDERRRFEDWLAGLEARRETTPPRVFERVHADYTSRLDAVIAQLRSHTDGLREELGGLTKQLGALHDEQQRVRDERAEAELRAHVGELPAERWETMARTADERIASLVAQHGEVEAELQRTRDLLADAERPFTPVQSSPAVGHPDAVTAVGDSAEGMAHVPAAAEPATPPAGKRPADVEVPTEVSPAMLAAQGELLDTVVPPAPAAPPAKRGRASSFDELAFLNSVVDSPQKPATQAFSAARTEEGKGAPRADEPPRPSQPWAARSAAPARRDEPRRQPSEIQNLDADADKPLLGAAAKPGTPMAANISGNNPIVLRDTPSANAKTLKCADCGAMNFPTEWYCERCGAELASL